VEFVGKGPLEAGLRQLAVQLGVAERCHFSGAIPHAQVLGRMASATATIVPSRIEAFGLVYIESMAVGTPVVASRVGGIPEIVRDGVDGLLAPPDDPGALASCIKAILSNPQLRQQMSVNARQRFLSTFEQTRIVKEQADWLERILSDPRTPAGQ
jgi:glycosyltransferase involved in cell wall biosynthesis